MDVHYLRVANVQDGYLDLDQMSTIRLGRDELVRYAVLPGDVLMNEGGDLDQLGRGAMWRGEFDPCVHQNHVFVVRCRPGLLPEFLNAWTASTPARRYFLLAGKQTTNLASINKTALGELPVLMPQPEEQRAIAEALSDVDGLLGALDALIAKKRAIKQAAMHQLLTGKTRLPGFTEEWTRKRFGEIASVRNDKVMPADVQPDTFCIELEHIGQGDGQLAGSASASGSTASKYRFLAGDVLFGRLRPYLRKFWLANREGICSTEVWPITVNSEWLHPGFLFALVQSDAFIDAASVSYGTHMPRADWGVMRAIELCLPPVEEQAAIASVLAEMVAEIAALSARRDKTRAIKQGMMQQLLTGRVRLVPSSTAGPSTC